MLGGGEQMGISCVEWTIHCYECAEFIDVARFGGAVEYACELDARGLLVSGGQGPSCRTLARERYLSQVQRVDERR